MSTEVVLGRGALTVEVALRPFAFTIRRSGRRLVRSGGIWVADGTIRDHFIQLTEGVLAHEERSPAAHGLRASITSVRTDEAQLDVLLHGGRRARLSIGDRISVSARAHAGPLRVSLFCQRTPAARLRALCHRTGFPQLLPEWGYGFWKSRDVYEHQDDVLDDFSGFRRNQIPLDAIVIDSPWATQYNTWKFNPHQFPDAPATIARMRADGVRTVVWVTPWVNLDSRDGQIPPQPESERLHRQPAPNYESGAAAGHFVRLCSGEPFVAQWWMGTGSTVDFTSGAAESWWRAQAKGVLELGVEGIKADDGEGYYVPDDVQLSDGRTGAEAAWTLGGLHRACLQRALEETHGANGVLFGRSGWTGQHAVGITWAGDQASDFWSLRVLVISALAAACSGLSNFSHDIGGYLGHRLVERCPAELLVRWIQFGCFTPLMQAHGRFEHEAWNHSDEDRLVLIVDLWHPDLSSTEITLLEGLHSYTSASAQRLSRYWATNDAATAR